MSDTMIIWNRATGTGDWAMDGPTLLSGGELESAVLISLFTDRTAGEDDEIPDGTGDPRGWWGDLGQAVPIGSRLWLLEREKKTPETLNRARDYIGEALQWLIDDSVVGSFGIDVEWQNGGVLAARVVAFRPDGSKVAMQFSWIWNRTN
ncbi:phage GP46 family protein [Pseudoduganella sp. RAF53_2]|uniref:phage GP46 family protein n=1 Tax=unclassified Pseudoduganella TaxID=2637179 RepID=UPI003F98B073